VGRLEFFPANERSAQVFFRITFLLRVLDFDPWAIFWSDLQKGE